MCGRFTLHLPPELIAGIFKVSLSTVFSPRFNVTPAQMHPVVRQTGEGRGIVPMKWGLIPNWAQDPRLGFSMINARAETVAEKPAFRGSFRVRRCLVVADGFFEWRHGGEAKAPFYVTLGTGDVMPFAGLWDSWRDPAGDAVETFTIITCAANGLVRELHDRMPVVIDRKNYGTWLDPATPTEKAKELLRPYPAERMTFWKVGDFVNNPRNDSEECIRKI
ncbi:MAG TPA: SOS response-associated peptidase [Geobacteraceae bacterium]|nr:SOS response-associated peptidase [Geobacteraceae bacterium]